MIIESKEVDTTNIYCMDMTKILSAESYLSREEGSAADPKSKEDFCDIVDVITNDAKVFIKKPDNSSFEQSIFFQLLFHLSELTTGQKINSGSKINVNNGVFDDALSLASDFQSYYLKPTVKQDINQWVIFQISDEERQRLFWDTNRLDDLEDALKGLKEGLKNKISQIQLDTENYRQTLRKTAMGMDKGMYGYAQRFFDTNKLTPEEFAIAYTFWAFIKGARYASSLNDKNNYCVHWLREDVSKRGRKSEVVATHSINEDVPWGELINYALEDGGRVMTKESFKEALLELREYTREQRVKYENIKYRLEYLNEGFRLFQKTLENKKNDYLEIYGSKNFLPSFVEANEIHISPEGGISDSFFVLSNVKRGVYPENTDRHINIVTPNYGKVSEFGRLSGFISGIR